MKRFLGGCVLSTVAVLATGCAVQAPVQQPTNGAYGQPAVQYGQVQSVDRAQVRGESRGGGAVLGGVIGAVLGRQVGHGIDRDAATAIGAVGGALLGNEIEKNGSGTREVYRVVVRLDDGSTRSIDLPQQPGDVRAGDRVRLDDKRITRVW